jgi:hypothetical protein
MQYRTIRTFDLLIMASGVLHIGENAKEWSLREGDYEEETVFCLDGMVDRLRNWVRC